MLYVLHGQDDFSLREALAEIKEGLGDGELVATNTTILQGQQLTPEQLIIICDKLPFLAPKHLVIVEGLLSRFEQRDRGQRSLSPEALGWQSLKGYISRMPESTVLVLVDGRLRRSNLLLRELAPQATVREFTPLKDAGLLNWIQSRAKERECNISPAALRLLADLIGGNLWLLSSEIDKLCLYTRGGVVGENDVRSLVAYAREANVFAMVDAILERRSAAATQLLHCLEDEGAAPSYLLFMITRQFRMVIQAKDLLHQQRTAAEITHSLGLTSDYALRKTMGQAQGHSIGQLAEVHRKLLDTDILIKTGKLKGEVALDLLISELCGEPSSGKGQWP